ncbi:Hypothetical protein CINCED_3A015675 [Cinara cedri]|uniref:Uncharacterized protein n=1 Tax=Cinara cedri TaxID=506608 RepID=A0A5E4NQY9_9HEMI|nr:Hypothetical protein CINCED_3A015675 [Cinara cedri]
MIALILDDEEENKIKRRAKKTWIRKIFTTRKFEEYHSLFKELEDEEMSFYDYFRMCQINII